MAITEETALCVNSPNRLPNPLGPCFSVTVLARWRHLHAAPPRVKRVRRPFYARIPPHASAPKPLARDADPTPCGRFYLCSVDKSKQSLDKARGGASVGGDLLPANHHFGGAEHCLWPRSSPMGAWGTQFHIRLIKNVAEQMRASRILEAVRILSIKSMRQRALQH